MSFLALTKSSRPEGQSAGLIISLQKCTVMLSCLSLCPLNCKEIMLQLLGASSDLTGDKLSSYSEILFIWI